MGLNMKLLKYLLVLSFLGYLSSCAIAPLTEPHTARTLGQGNNEWTGSLGFPYISAGYQRGVLENLDIGVLVELQGYGVPLLALESKYAFFQQERGMAFALVGGVGIAQYSKIWYIGPVFSFHPSSQWEVSLAGKLNGFLWSESDDFDLTDIEDEFADIYDEFFDPHHYVSIDLSNTYWFHEGFGLTGSVSSVFFSLDELQFKGGLKFNFRY